MELIVAAKDACEEEHGKKKKNLLAHSRDIKACEFCSVLKQWLLYKNIDKEKSEKENQN